jgi:hypothetical protein
MIGNQPKQPGHFNELACYSSSHFLDQYNH